MTEIHVNNKNGVSILEAFANNVDKCNIDCTIYAKKICMEER